GRGRVRGVDGVARLAGRAALATEGRERGADALVGGRLRGRRLGQGRDGGAVGARDRVAAAARRLGAGGRRGGGDGQRLVGAVLERRGRGRGGRGRVEIAADRAGGLGGGPVALHERGDRGQQGY